MKHIIKPASILAAVALALGMTLVPALAAQAVPTTYYVDSGGGSDAATGTSPGAAWQSLSKVASVSFAPGDVIKFIRGGHWTTQLTLNSSGTSGSPITLTSYGTGNPAPWFSFNCGQGLTVTGDYVVIDGMYFADEGAPCYANAYNDPNTAYYGGGAVYFPAGAEHNIVRNSEFTNVGIGVRVRGDYNAVTHNWFHDLHFVVPQANGPAGSYGAIGVSLGSSHLEVAYNRFERCRASRLLSSDTHSNYDGGAIEIEGHFYNTHDVITDVSIHHNWSKDNEGFGEVDVSDPSNIRFSYNYSDDYQQFWGFATNSYLTMGTGWVFDHNTIVRRSRTIGYTWDIQTYFNTTPPSYNFSLWTNNVYYIASGFKVQPLNDEPHNHNLYYSTAGTSAYAILGSGSFGTGDVVADPLFSGTQPFDGHLSPGSPAINPGTASSPSFSYDFDGKSSSVSTAADIGAYEYAGSANPNLLQDPGFESQTDSTLQHQWMKDDGPGAVGTDYHLSGYPHSGSNNAWISSTTTGVWSSIGQRDIEVQPGVNYTISCWERDSGGITPYLGVYYTSAKTAGAKAESSFSSSTSFHQLSYSFNSGAYSRVSFYAGYAGVASTYMVIDDCVLRRT